MQWLPQRVPRNVYEVCSRKMRCDEMRFVRCGVSCGSEVCNVRRIGGGGGREVGEGSVRKRRSYMEQVQMGDGKIKSDRKEKPSDAVGSNAKVDETRAGKGADPSCEMGPVQKW